MIAFAEIPPQPAPRTLRMSARQWKLMERLNREWDHLDPSVARIALATILTGPQLALYLDAASKGEKLIFHIEEP